MFPKKYKIIKGLGMKCKDKQLNCEIEKIKIPPEVLHEAMSGSVEKMLLLGRMYGQTMLNNAEKSFYWMQKASDAGSVEALYILGEYYLEGYGVTQSRIVGTRYILQAAHKGNERAIECLKNYGMSYEEMKSMGIIE